MEKVTSSTQRTYGSGYRGADNSSRKKNPYGLGGFGGGVWTSCAGVEQEEWDRIFGKKDSNSGQTQD